MHKLWQSGWGDSGHDTWKPILARSLVHVIARADEALVGFVNVAWDGGVHAFLLDTTVHRDWQRGGIGSSLVRMAATAAKDRGAHWLHVDCEAELEGFYGCCGFERTRAGLMRLGSHDTGCAPTLCS